MKRLFNKARLTLALWLLSGLPENVWLGRHAGAYTCRTKWSAGRIDSRGVLQGCALASVFSAK
jgi:hypothetical protein